MMKQIAETVSKKRNRSALIKQLRMELDDMKAPQGAQLPSCRDWSRQLGASYSSVHRALCELQKEGRIEARSRSGWYIASASGTTRPTKSRKTIRAVRTREVVFPFLSEGDEDYIADRAENWSGTILSSISRNLGQKGMRLSLLNDSSTLESDKLPAKTIRLIESMPQPPAGVIMFAQPGLEAFREWLQMRGIPNLTIGVPNDSTTTNFVSTNFREMGRVAGVAFGTCGFDRVVYLYGDFHQLPAERQRLEGLCSGFAETTGRLPTALGFGFAANSPREFGWRAMTDHLKRTNAPPQAVFAAGDYLAIGAIQALRDFGLRCPEQVVVIGTTGLDFAGLTRPSITTIDQPMQELGKQAADMLARMTDQPNNSVPGVILPSRMTFRESFPANDDLITTLRSDFKGLQLSFATPINQIPETPLVETTAPVPTT